MFRSVFACLLVIFHNKIRSQTQQVDTGKTCFSPTWAVDAKVILELLQIVSTPECSLQILKNSDHLPNEKICSTVNKIFRRNPVNQTKLLNSSQIPNLPEHLVDYMINGCEFTSSMEHAATPFWKRAMITFLMITVINSLSCSGVWMFGVYNKPKFRLLLLLCMSFSVGVLSTNGLVHLIPESYGFNPAKSTVYVKTAVFSLLGILCFAAMEIFLKIYVHARAKRLSKASILDNESSVKKTKLAEEGKDAIQKRIELSKSLPQAFYSPVWLDPRVPSYATLITVGDACHNFMDGIAIGASFAYSLTQGYVTFMGVLAEELPQEIGDYASLLCAGLNPKQALFWNLMSSLSCYIGAGVGLYFGEVSGMAHYVDAFCGGMFLYISLYAVLPEIVDEIFTIFENDPFKLAWATLLVMFFIMTGMAFMVGMALLAKYI